MALVVVFCLFVFCFFNPNILADLAESLLDSEREWIISSQQRQGKKKILDSTVILIGGVPWATVISCHKRGKLLLNLLP